MITAGRQFPLALGLVSRLPFGGQGWLPLATDPGKLLPHPAPVIGG